MFQDSWPCPRVWAELSLLAGSIKLAVPPSPHPELETANLTQLLQGWGEHEDHTYSTAGTGKLWYVSTLSPTHALDAPNSLVTCSGWNLTCPELEPQCLAAMQGKAAGWTKTSMGTWGWGLGAGGLVQKCRQNCSCSCGQVLILSQYFPMMPK